MSTSFTKVGAIGSVVFAIGTLFLLFPLVLSQSEGFQINLLNAGILLVGLLVLTVYQLIFAAEAALYGKTPPPK